MNNDDVMRNVMNNDKDKQQWHYKEWKKTMAQWTMSQIHEVVAMMNSATKTNSNGVMNNVMLNTDGVMAWQQAMKNQWQHQNFLQVMVRITLKQ